MLLRSILVLATTAVGTAALSAPASAQSINLTGVYTCVQMCPMGLDGHRAYITQNGPDLDLLNVTGQPARAWPDWFAPENRIWIDAWNEGAVYSPDGRIIQFDDGTIWRRDLGRLARARN